MKLEYSFEYLPKSDQALNDYLNSLGLEMICKLQRGLLVSMKTHWHTYQYICETDNAVCLGWDAYPESLYCVDENYFYVFWVPKRIFQKDWKRCLFNTKETRGYFLDEQYDNRTGQMSLFC